MKYLRADLNEKYQRLVKAYPDSPSIAHPLMNTSDVLRAYFILADYFTDPTADSAVEPMLVEVLHMDMLVSALGRQTSSFMGKIKYRDALHICATLFYGLVKNHCFVDGNKRTALHTLLYQLDCYGYLPTTNTKEFERLTVAVAANTLETQYRHQWKKTREIADITDRRVETIYRCLKQLCAKKDNSFHIDITARDFIQAMNSIDGCSCEVEGNKIKVKRVIPRKIWIFNSTPIEKAFTIPYHGATRTIGAETARNILVGLELYEQYPDYRSLIEGNDARYMLIAQFEGPLRRLKDK